MRFGIKIIETSAIILFSAHLLLYLDNMGNSFLTSTFTMAVQSHAAFYGRRVSMSVAACINQIKWEFLIDK